MLIIPKSAGCKRGFSKNKKGGFLRTAFAERKFVLKLWLSGKKEVCNLAGARGGEEKARLIFRVGEAWLSLIFAADFKTGKIGVYLI